MKVCVLGPAGTFSEEAALTFFPEADLELLPNLDDLFESIGREGKLGFVPFENSLHGSVDEVLDFLVQTTVCVWRTHDVRIVHAFGARDPKTVTKIASHPQAIAQCRPYLRRRFPHVELFPVNSTVSAIDLALRDPTVGAIALKKTMEERGLAVVSEEVEGENNTTRFAVVAKDDPFPASARTQMGIVFHPVGDRSGLLHDILVPFKIYDVNLTRIENRPTGRKLGDYLFFLHFQGTRSDARVLKVLEELGRIKEIEIVKVLGEW